MHEKSTSQTYYIRVPDKEFHFLEELRGRHNVGKQAIFVFLVRFIMKRYKVEDLDEYFIG